MRALVQRVSSATVRVDGHPPAAIGRGLLVFLGVTHADTTADADYLAGKLARLRVFEDDAGRMNRSTPEVGGEYLVISQFTLFGDCRRGNRPGFTDAAAPEHAEPLYRYFAGALEAASGRPVRTGVFGAHMRVSLDNDGPVTLGLESPPPGGRE